MIQDEDSEKKAQFPGLQRAVTPVPPIPPTGATPPAAPAPAPPAAPATPGPDGEMPPPPQRPVGGTPAPAVPSARPPRPPAPEGQTPSPTRNTPPREGTAGGGGTAAPSPGATPTPAAPWTAAPLGALGTQANEGGSFKNIQNFLAANAPAEAEYAKGYANSLGQEAEKLTNTPGAIPTGAQYSASMAVSGSTGGPSPVTSAQAADLAYRLGNAARPGAYGQWAQSQGGQNYTSGQRKLDEYLYGASPGAQAGAREAQQKFGGLVGLVQNYTPKGSKVDPVTGNVVLPTPPEPPSPHPARGGSEGDGEEAHPGKVWSEYSNSWVSPALLAKQEQLAENRDRNSGGSGRETP